MQKVLSVLLCLLAAAAVYSKESEIFSLNFNRGFKPGLVAGQGVCPGGKWKTSGENFFIVSDPVKSAPYALKIMRDGQGGYFAAIPDKPIPAGHN